MRILCRGNQRALIARGCAFVNDDQIGDWGDGDDSDEGGRKVQKAEWNVA